jgi:hypothetical protein
MVTLLCRMFVLKVCGDAKNLPRQQRMAVAEEDAQ